MRVSPAGISVSSHGEAPPILQILPGGSLTVAYAAALPGQWKNEIRLQTSTDGGAHWGAAERLHPERIGAHSYLSAAVTAAGEPVFARKTAVIRHVKLGADSSPHPKLAMDQFVLHPKVVELFAELDRLQNGWIDRIEVCHGIPLDLFVREAAA